MKVGTVPCLWPLLTLAAVGSLSFPTDLCLAADEATKSSNNGERREEISLADAALRALKNNLDISISRHTKKAA